MSYLLVAPVGLPLLMAVAGLLAYRHGAAQRALAIAGATSLLATAIMIFAVVEGDGPQAVQVGGWAAPFGITLVADLLAAMMLVLAGIVGLCAAVYSVSSVDTRRGAFGNFVLLNVLLAGVAGAFLTGDLFNLYVWFEVILITSFVLLALGGEREQLEGAIKYVALNLVGSALFLAGAGLTYGLTGTLNMADLAQRLPGTEPEGLVTAISILFLVAFGLKAAVFPLFFWLPASYHTPQADITILFSGLLTKVGVYALLRTFTLVLAGDDDFTQSVLLVVAAFTMVTGVLGALAQVEFRRVLSFHIVSQIGYMLLGLGLFTPLAIAGSIFFLAHNMFAKTALFVVSGIIERTQGTGALKQLGGLYPSRPALVVVFVLAAASLAGIPPLAGFVGKLTLVRAGIEEEAYWIVAVALLVGIGTLMSMTKLWMEAFWKPAPEGSGNDEPGRDSLSLLAPGLGLALLGVAMGVGAGPVLDLSLRAAEGLLAPEAYVDAVLGEQDVDSGSVQP